MANKEAYATLSIVAVLIITITYGALFSGGTGPLSLFGNDDTKGRSLWWFNSIAFVTGVLLLILSTMGTIIQDDCPVNFFIIYIVFFLSVIGITGAFIAAGYVLDPGAKKYKFGLDYQDHVDEHIDDLNKLISATPGGNSKDKQNTLTMMVVPISVALIYSIIYVICYRKRCFAQANADAAQADANAVVQTVIQATTNLQDAAQANANAAQANANAAQAVIQATTELQDAVQANANAAQANADAVVQAVIQATKAPQNAAQSV